MSDTTELRQRASEKHLLRLLLSDIAENFNRECQVYWTNNVEAFFITLSNDIYLAKD
jgi:hypothetical protein